MRRRLSSAAWLGFLLLTLVSSPASAFERFDFEGPYLLDNEHTLKDHSIVRINGTTHCFYIRGDEDTGTATENALGHATTEDLSTWSILTPAVAAGPDFWDSRNVWAPHVVPTPGSSSQWTMFYTGTTPLVVQRMGTAVSFGPSISLWSKTLLNPVAEPDSMTYQWGSSLSFSSFRDPFYFEHNGTHHLLHTAVIPDSTVSAGRRGAIHHLTSNTFGNWVEQPPLALHNGPDNAAWHEIESIQLFERNGFWHMFYTETNLQGVQHLRSTQMDSGWDFNQSVTIDIGIAAEVTPIGNDRYLFTRHIASSHAYDVSDLFWSIRADTLSFDGNDMPVITRTDVISSDWPVRTGTSFLAVPTFGDNSLERGEAATGPDGHGYIGSKEFYAGPLSGFGGPGVQLGGGATGTLKSRVFTITGERMRLKVGGGLDPNCFVALVESGPETVLASATGQGIDTMSQIEWDLIPHMGKSVYLWIEDASNAADGYISVDTIEELGSATATPTPATSAATLLANLPNPFNPRTTLRMQVDVAGQYHLRLFDLRGREVRRLAPRHLEPGTHAQTWSGDDHRGEPVASGVYVVELRRGDQRVDSQRVTLVR